MAGDDGDKRIARRDGVNNIQSGSEQIKRPPDDPSAPRYWAFISYSHRDQRISEKLHRMLETWVVPRRLRGRQTGAGAIPRRLYPVFRDRDELAGSADLGESLRTALAAARCLIVICSPAAARSHWVNEEVRLFKSLYGEQRVFCLVVEGELRAGSEHDCLPPALRFRVGTDGALSTTPAEPIAADARAGADGWQGAVLKLIAGMLGVGFEELRRRDRRRRLLNGLIATATAAALLLGFGALWNARAARYAEQQRQAQIARLIDSGRHDLQRGERARAASWLIAARRLGAEGAALSALLGEATRALDAIDTTLTGSKALYAASFDAAGEQVVTTAQDGSACVWRWRQRQRGACFALSDPQRFQLLTVPAFAAGGRSVISTVREQGLPREFRIWDVASGARTRAVAVKPGDWPQVADVDAAGARLAWLPPEGGLRMQLLSGLQPLPFPLSATARPTALAFAASGSRLLLGDENGEVRVHDAASGALLQRYTGLRAPVRLLAQDPGLRRLIAADTGGAIRAWDQPSGRLLFAAGHAGTVLGLMPDRAGSRLASFGADGVRVWNLDDGRLLFVLNLSYEAGSTAVLSADGRSLIVSAAGRVAVWDIDTGHELFALDAHPGAASFVDATAAGDRLLTAGADGRVVIWRWPPRPLARLAAAAPLAEPDDGGLRPIRTDVLSSPAGESLLVLAAEGGARLLDATTLATRQVLDAGLRVTAAAFSNDGLLLVTGRYDGRIALWRRAGRSAAFVAAGELDGAQMPRRLLLTPGGGHLLVSDYDLQFRLWDLRSKRVLMEARLDSLNALALSRDGQRFAIGRGGSIEFRELATQVLSASTPSAPIAKQQCLAFSPDGTSLAVKDGARKLRLLDTRSGAVLATVQDPNAQFCNDAQFSPDGQRIAFADAGRNALVWDGSATAGIQLRGHAASVTLSRFIAGGALLLTGSKDGVVKLWDAASGEFLYDAAVQTGEIRGFSLLGETRLAAIGTRGELRLWSLAAETRSQPQLEALLRCRSPWQLDHAALAAHAPQDQNCATRP